MSAKLEPKGRRVKAIVQAVDTSMVDASTLNATATPQDPETTEIIPEVLSILKEHEEVKRTNPSARAPKLHLLDKIPAPFAHKEFPHVYSQIPEVIHKEYLGRDYPGTFKSICLKRRCNVRTQASDVWYEFGSPAAGRYDSDQVYLRIHPDTQYPSFALLLDGCEARIFAEHVKHFEINWGAGIDKDYIGDLDPALSDAAKQQTVLQITLILKDDGEVPISGSNADQREAWSSDWETSPGQNCQKAIAAGKHFIIQAIVGHKESTHMLHFMEHIRATFDMTMKHGEDWFLKLAEPGFADLPRDYPLSTQHVPLWMVLKWLPTYDRANDTIVSVQPFAWASYNIPKVWSSPKKSLAAWRISSIRTRDPSILTLDELLKNADGEIRAEFTQSGQDPSVYRVDCWISLSGRATSTEALAPEVDTRLKFLVMNEDGVFANEYKGKITPDLWNSQSTFSAIVRGPTDPYLVRTDEGGYPIYNFVAVRLDTTTTSADRQIAAFEDAERLMGEDLVQGREGPDFAFYFYKAKRTIKVCNPWAKNMPPGQAEAIYKYGENKKLNQIQQSVLIDACTNDQGITAISGPPGTGKTETIAAVVRSIVLTNKKYRKNKKLNVLVTAPSNAAVNHDFFKLLSEDPEMKEIKIVRFFGARKKVKPVVKDADTPMTDDAELEDLEAEELDGCFWDMADIDGERKCQYSNLAKYTWQEQLKAWMSEQAKPNSANEINKEQVAILTAAKVALKGRNRTADERKQLRATIAYFEHILTIEWAKTIDVMCATLNTSAHEWLRTYFPAACILIDEVGMALDGDLATTYVSNWKTIQHMFIAGDSQQQYAMVKADGRNEYSRLMVESFLYAVERGYTELKPIALKNQYRMCTEISDMVSHLFYNDTLINDPSVDKPTHQGVQVQDFFKANLGAAYNNWNCFGIDVSGSDAYSQIYRKTTSLSNSVECDTVEAIVERLLKFSGSRNLPKVEKRDIMVHTPYTGHQLELTERFGRSGLLDDDNDDENVLLVSTVAAVQGKERPIVIYTFCVNREGNPLSIQFAAEKHSLCVATSRAKSSLIIVGNWKAWTEGVVNDDPRFCNKQSNLYPFGQMVRYLSTGDCKVVSRQAMRNWLTHNRQTDKVDFPETIERFQKFAISQPGEKRKANQDALGSVNKIGKATRAATARDMQSLRKVPPAPPIDPQQQAIIDTQLVLFKESVKNVDLSELEAYQVEVGKLKGKNLAPFVEKSLKEYLSAKFTQDRANKGLLYQKGNTQVKK